jgi:hypothetical protein
MAVVLELLVKGEVKLPPRNKTFLKKLIITQLIKEFPTLFETRRLIAVIATEPCPEQVENSPYSHTPLFQDPF